MKKDSFLYQINFNRKKFPEICEALEEAKKENGVAWYLRQLIRKDIEEKKKEHSPYKEHDQYTEKIERPKEKETEEFSDNTGGFL